MNQTTPDWDVAVVDGEPQVVINHHALAELAKASPVGVDEALRRLKSVLPVEHYAKVEGLVTA